MLSPRLPPIRGRGRIEEHYVGDGSTLLPLAIAYATEASVGCVIGGYRYREGPDVGTFTLTLQKASGGRWLIVSDMETLTVHAPASDPARLGRFPREVRGA